MAEVDRIVVLDDEVSVLELFVAVLGGTPLEPGGLASRLPTSITLDDGPFAGTELLLASTAEDACAHVRRALAEERPVQGGFFDLKLRHDVGGLDAIETCREIDPRLLVTVVTGYRDCSIEKIHELFLPDHGDQWDYLCKPFTRSEIRQKLRQMVSSWHRRRREERQSSEIRDLNERLRAWSDELEQRVADRTAELARANGELGRRNQQLEDVLEELSATQARLVQHEKMSSLYQLSSGIAQEVSRPLRFARHGLDELARRLERLALLHDRVTELARPAPASSSEVVELREQLEAARADSAAEAALHEASDLIADCTGAAERVDRIVSSLRLFARPGRDAAKPTRVEKGLEATLSLVPAHLRERGRIELRFADDTPPIESHGGELEQAWLALVVNALESVDQGGTVTVATRTENGETVVEVEDDGPGMTADVVERATEPFFTTRAKPGNVGLGLSIVHGIVERHGGRLEIDSAPGQGTLVRVRLPSAFQAAAVS